MRILVAPDKFKGSLTATQVCDAIERGLSNYNSSFDVRKIPLADGGDGSLEVIRPYLGLKSKTLTVMDPLRRPISASYLYSSETAYIEMAAASGINLLDKKERDCLRTTSYGTGQLIVDACQNGLQDIFLFVGGSATNDGGIGILEALGILPMSHGVRLDSVGENLQRITEFESTGQLFNTIRFTLVCDVMNPLYGKDGAAYVYGPQKGADEHAVRLLDDGLRNLAEVIWKSRKVKVSEFPGAGAAGGVAAGLKAFFSVKIKQGIESIMEIVKLSYEIDTSDLVITGEGKFDYQTLQGKVVKGVYDLCLEKEKKLALICGVQALEDAQLAKLKFWKIASLVGPGTSEEQAVNNAEDLLTDRAFQLMDGSE